MNLANKSGAQKRKEQQLRIQQQIEVMSKIPKLQTFFKRKNDKPDDQPTERDINNNCASEDLNSLSDCSETICVDHSMLSNVDLEMNNEEVTEINMSVDNEGVKVTEYSTDIGLWGDDISNDMQEYCIAKGADFFQHSEAGFQNSAVLTNANYYRYCNKSYFTHLNPKTNEIATRNWLCYSPSQGKLYCFPCKLLSSKRGAFIHGFNDWKHAEDRLFTHECSETHKQAVLSVVTRQQAASRVDSQLVLQMESEKIYWRKVLKRALSVITFLSERGLPFRGKNEIIGSSHNGNYLGILEVMANVDEFLDEHIKHHANKGRGHTSYLSSTVCEELIELLGLNVLSLIVHELKKAKFYSISVDSTPDVSNCDQLTFILRYVLPSGPIERFLQFIPAIGHTGKQIAEVITGMLLKYDINIKDCRGQSYDNAANMSGKYCGVQAHIRDLCPYATFIPCAAHSLNLVGKNSAECNPEVYRFFNSLEQLYVFFSSSTARWRLLVDKLKPLGLPVVKHLSATRWSARYDAVLALYKGYEPICNLLDCMAKDSDYSSCKNEADSLGDKFSELDCTFLLVLWHTVLERFHKTNLSLQEAGLNLNTVVDLLQSLLDFVQSQREEFDTYEREAIRLCGHDVYKSAMRRNRPRNRRYDDGEGDETMLTPRDTFKTQVFISVIDHLTSGLRHRVGAYRDVSSKFGFLYNLSDLSPADIKKSGKNLVCSYPDDLMTGVTETELVQFSKFLSIQKKNGKAFSELQMFLFLHERCLTQTFPNTEIILRIYLSLMVSNCSGERSFSKLKRIKNELRSQMGQDRLNHLSLLSIEHKLLRTLDMSKLIDEYSSKKSRKKTM